MRNRLVLCSLLMFSLAGCQSSPNLSVASGDASTQAAVYQVQQPDYQVQQQIRRLGRTRYPTWELEQEVIRLTNLERQKAGLAPLTTNPIIRVVARRHSQDMAKRNYFAHVNPEGQGPAERLRAYVNYAHSALAENIRWISDRDPSTVARDIMYTGPNAWMNSPGHRANILNPNFTHVAVAMARGSDGRYIATQIFMRRP